MNVTNRNQLYLLKMKNYYIQIIIGAYLGLSKVPLTKRRFSKINGRLTNGKTVIFKLLTKRIAVFEKVNA